MDEERANGRAFRGLLTFLRVKMWDVVVRHAWTPSKV
jgi:hypothetical protein